MREVSVSVREQAPGDESACQLARKLSLPLNEDSTSHYLRYDTNGILWLVERDTDVSISADFSNPSLLYRLTRSLKQEMLVRAVGVKVGRDTHVVDATAGLGQDAFLLAAAGCEVTLIERSPVVAALLDNALESVRRNPNPTVSDTVARMSLIQGDSMAVLASLPPPQVIYLDPMFPVRRKSARVRKNMTMLQAILGEGDGSGSGVDDSPALLTFARQKALDRVVVKRPRLAPSMGGDKPDWQHTGRSSRFDVYRSIR